jgi:lipopolysaccharide transport system permease protein
VPVDFHELWEYRELLYCFVSRDVKVRYKQTALGFFWTIIQPLFMMVIFTLFLGWLQRFLRMTSRIPCSVMPRSSPARSPLNDSPDQRQAW